MGGGGYGAGSWRGGHSPPVMVVVVVVLVGFWSWGLTGTSAGVTRRY